jgi:hypothetical protein
VAPGSTGAMYRVVELRGRFSNTTLQSRELGKGPPDDSRYVGISIHHAARHHKLVGDCIWGLRSIRHARRNAARRLDRVFLASTVLTSLTGFFFPFAKLLPSHVVGIISLIVLALALLALYVFHLAGAWRWIYVAGTVLALYLNVFVAIVQAFQKLPFLRPLAPTQSEPPFAVTQVAAFVIFVVLGVVPLKSF